ncbi:hypothetical protein G6L37_00235 [Agrobacterium rubi]|nr:hypothetical protein [Agrobacterium rubi]NTF23678.1 hypothetical protein [Agrobacterium rubi]
MFDGGYSDDLARRNADRSGTRDRSLGDWIAFGLAVPAAWLFWGYVIAPVWQFVDEVSEAARIDQARQADISHMLGKCYKSAIGSVGAVIRIDSGTEVKMAFRGGVTGAYPVSALSPADCPSD